VTISRRLALSLFVLLLALFASLLFWPFVLDNLLTPIALVIWLLLRIFVLSIGQQYYWGAVTLAALFLLFRLLPDETASAAEENSLESNETMKTVEYWRSLFTLGDNNIRDSKTLKWELTRLLLSHFATRQHKAADFELYDALQRGDVPLPQNIHAFLFTEEPQVARRSLMQRLQAVGQAPRNWIRRWSGAEAAEYYHMIDAVFSFMEAFQETKNDDGRHIPDQH